MNSGKSNKTVFSFMLICLAVAPIVTSCLNVFDWADTPSGDEQIKSAARACFDQGDVDCARKLYEQLSENESDVANSELAFLILEENNIRMGTFITAFGEGDGAIGLSTLADALAIEANTARRQKIFEAFSKADLIASDQLRGFVRAVTALTLAAHLLAETHLADGVAGFTGDDFVSSKSTCKGQALAGCNDSSCAGIAQSIPNGGAAPTTSDTALVSSDSVTTLNLVLLHKTILAVDAAINEIGAGGKFETGLGSFLDQMAALSGISTNNCYRYLLISQGLAG